MFCSIFRIIFKSIRERMEQCKLALHPEKTKLVYCNRKGKQKRTKAKHRQFDFLGYTFASRKVKTKEGHIMFGFSPAISRKSEKRISALCRRLGFHSWTHMNIHQLAASLASNISGCLNYYGRFHKTALEGIFRVVNR